jgi:3-oxoacyl-[acyl-carrier protein] reductase
MALNGKTALITGCNRGIGLAILESFARHGCNVIAHTRRASPGFSAIVDKISRRYKVVVTLIHFDLENEQDIRIALKAVFEKKLPIDILVNSAGVIHGGLFLMTPLDDIRRVLEVNLYGMMAVTQLVSRYMLRKKSGSIINLASVAGIDLNAGNSAYGLSKAAVIAFSKTLSSELNSYGIRVNVVAPSLTDTDMAASSEARKERSILAEGKSSFSRLASPEEVAELVVYLASDAACFINGQVIRIDGGNKF